MEQTCPICKREMEDTRHVGVECFYAVDEVVPTIQKSLIFVEVPEDVTLWGITRRYSGGTRDKFSSTQEGNVKHLKSTQEPLSPDKIRLVEESLYSQTCCKSCRADFLAVFKRWCSGDFVTPEGDGRIPIRINGAVKYLTEEEYKKFCGSDSRL